MWRRSAGGVTVRKAAPSKRQQWGVKQVKSSEVKTGLQDRMNTEEHRTSQQEGLNTIKLQLRQNEQTLH